MPLLSPQHTTEAVPRQWHPVCESDLRNFARSWDVLHVTSSPEYPQSSGLGVGRSLKKLLEMTKRDGLLSEPVKPKERTLRQDPWFTCIKTIVQQLLKPESKAKTRIKAQLTKKRAVQKHCYDKSSKPLAPLTPSQGQCHRQTDVEKTPSRMSQ